MIERYLEKLCFSKIFGRQMRFVAGPRQVGKTTLAKKYLKDTGFEDLYYNWDLRTIKRRFIDDPYFYHSDAITIKTRRKKWICFDEIHKYPRWKDILKDGFDSFEQKYNFIVTGSARLDLFRKAGDSLSGRFFLFRLLPVSLFELMKSNFVLPTGNAIEYIEENIKSHCNQKQLDQLLKFGGFPEPLLKGNAVFSSNWHNNYIDTLVRSDLRDLTKIQELENIVTLMHLLPAKIGSPLSLNSLREDLNVSFNAIKNYVNSLILTYVIFNISPYSEKISRAVKKEKKVYFYDWTQVKDKAARFENYVACELKNRIELWNMATKYTFNLNFIRLRDKRETDFIITRDEKPFLLIETKLSSKNFESHNIDHSKILNVPLVQLIHDPDVIKAGKDNCYIVSASNFLS
ncbi:MAG: ATP-binding protein [Pseudomonadota bacterium]